MAAEGAYVAYHMLWALFFASQGYRISPIFEVYAAVPVLALMMYYGDDDVSWRYPIRCWPNSESEWAHAHDEEEAASTPLVSTSRGKKGRGAYSTYGSL